MLFYFTFASIFSMLAIFLFSSFPAVSMKEFYCIFWLGAIAHGLGFVTWFLALKYGDTAKVSNIAFLTPFLSLIFIYLIIGEKIYFTSILGLFFIITGLIIQQVNFKRTTKAVENIQNDYC
jgi:drug/metabolite transporter (DMT)-like permease